MPWPRIAISPKIVPASMIAVVRGVAPHHTGDHRQHTHHGHHGAEDQAADNAADDTPNDPLRERMLMACNRCHVFSSLFDQRPFAALKGKLRRTTNSIH